MWVSHSTVSLVSAVSSRDESSESDNGDSDQAQQQAVDADRTQPDDAHQQQQQQQLPQQQQQQQQQSSQDEPQQQELERSGLEDLVFDVFVGDHLILEPFVFDCWLLGMSPASIADERKRQRHNSTVSHALLLADSEDQCRSMAMLERYLRNAQQLSQQSLFQLDLPAQRRLVDKFYSLHDPLMRELAGRKLTSYLYKSLGDVAERLRVPQHLCERNFDNLRRVYKRVLDCVSASQEVLPTLERHYMLSEELALRYLRACFARFHRWELTKKKLNIISVADLEFFASVQMELWTREPNPLELDASFKAALREHRAALLNDKSVMLGYIGRVSAALQPLLPKMLLGKLTSKLSPLILKPLLQLAVDMSSAKQFRDFPLDLIENFAVPLRKFGVNRRECELLFGAFAQASNSREFARFIQAVALCVLRIFDLSLTA
jgi:hypothetical protein